VIDRALHHLRTIVGHSTVNPPRAITPDHPVIAHAAETLGGAGFTVEIEDLGEGCVCLLALRGNPALLVNCHLDTVPPDPDWSTDPFELRLEGDRVIGLGVCDVKGAAACQLAAAQETSGDAAILFTTDEEAGQSRCVRHAAERLAGRFASVVVSEPTNLRAVTAHRGVLSVEAEFFGDGGHASTVGRRGRSAIHDACDWCATALEQAERVDHLRFNVGAIQGGTKPNMIAARAAVRFSMRPETEADTRLDWLHACLPFGARTEWRTRFHAPPLRPTRESSELASELGLATGEPVMFWTEAALFAAHRLPTIVFGPGDIDQAHAPQESVPLAHLAGATETYARWFSDNARSTT